MWCVPLTDGSIRDVFLMIGCPMDRGQGRVADVCWVCLHAPPAARRWRGRKVAGAVEGVSTPWPASCRIFQIIFLVNIFLRLKEDALTGSIISKTGTNQSVNPFTFKEDTHPRLIWPQRAHPWQTLSQVYKPLILRVFAIMCKLCSSLVTTFNTKCTSRI